MAIEDSEESGLNHISTSLDAAHPLMHCTLDRKLFYVICEGFCGFE
jgi:hypothetical protein